MATETKNLKLSKPEATDFYDIALQNENMDKVDEAIAGKANKTDIPSIPGSLPADGGNADTVGGKSPSDFAEVNHNHDDRYYTEFEIDTKMNNKQNSLGFTPIQQGTGIGQETNVVKIGWSATSRLKVTVDGTDLGNVVFDRNLPTSLPANGGNANYANGAGVSNTTNQLSVTSGAPASPFVGQLWIW